MRTSRSFHCRRLELDATPLARPRAQCAGRAAVELHQVDWQSTASMSTSGNASEEEGLCERKPLAQWPEVFQLESATADFRAYGRLRPA